MLLLSVPLSGCATVKGDSYCDISRPILFESQMIVYDLVQMDRQLVQDIVTHNEVYERLCD